MWAYLCTIKAFLAIFSWHILSLGLIMGWLLNNRDEKQNGADLKTINMSWCQLMVHLCFDSTPAISMTPTTFDLIWSISIYFNHFDHSNLFWSFQSVSIHFNSGIKIAKLFRLYAGHFDILLLLCWWTRLQVG
jgi:hypothetical protein